VCSVPFTNNDGSESKRPVLVLFNGPTGIGEDEVSIVAHITASPERVRNQYKGDISLEDNPSNYGLSRPSVIRCRQCLGIPRNLVIGVVGRVGPEILNEAQEYVSEIVNGY